MILTKKKKSWCVSELNDLISFLQFFYEAVFIASTIPVKKSEIQKVN